MNKVGVIMGSKSDYPVMEEAISILKDLDSSGESVIFGKSIDIVLFILGVQGSEYI